MEPILVDQEELHIVGFAKDYAHNEDTRTLIPQLWDTYLSRQHEIENWIQPVSVGICHSGSEHGFSYFVGGIVRAPGAIPAGMTAMTIPAQRFVRFTCKGGADKIGAHWHYIHNVWGKRTTLERSGVDFEYYDERFHPDSDTAELDIYVGVKKEGSGR